jgi:hypothetical protein
MIREALVQDDHDTTILLVDQAIKIRNAAIIEKVFAHYVSSKEYNYATKLIEKCELHAIQLSETLCKELAHNCVFNAEWSYAHQVLAYMIQKKINFSERLVFFTLSGLLASDRRSIISGMQLIKLIVLHQREELAKYISFSKVIIFIYI